jgi:hypothetical protein
MTVAITIADSQAPDAPGDAAILSSYFDDWLDTVFGRDAEIGQLRRLLAELAAGRGRCVWLEGEPGIGKSALLIQVYAAAAEYDCWILSSVADESSREFPLRIVLDGLRMGSPYTDASYEQLVGLLMGDGTVDGAIPPNGAALGAERYFDVVERLCVQSPVVLVTDDMQWADEMSLAVWAPATRRPGPLLLVGAYRPIPARASAVALTRGLPNAPATVITLGPLLSADVPQMIGGLLGALPGPG